MKTTFKQFLLVEDTSVDLVQLLKDKCKPFLNASKGFGLLHRGIPDVGTNGKKVNVHGSNYLYWTKDVRKDRMPKDSSPQFHKDTDAWFLKEFGFKARSQAVFCFGDGAKRTDISMYGPEYIIFPVGEFKYVWSPEVKDLFLASTADFSNYSDDVSDDIKSKMTPLEYFLSSKSYTDKDLHVAIKKNNEIMISCDQYLIFEKFLEGALRDAVEKAL